MNHFLRLFVFSAIAIFSSSLYASGGASEGEEVNVTEVIMHHVQDAHEFHVVGDFTIPLPVILWTDNGLAFFMSSAFDHNDDGTKVVEKNGSKLVKYHEKIYYANEAGGVSLDEKGEVTNAKPMDFSITKNVFTLLMSVFVLIFLFVKTANSYAANGAPKGIAKFLEPLVIFVRDDIAIENIGEKKHAKYLPYLLTIFFFIWINNLFGLVPFFPFSANLSGNIAFTMALALLTFIITNLSGNKDYWKHIFWMPGVPVPMKVFLAPIEFIGIFTKPISLFIRLFANITAGHIVVLALVGLIFFFRNLYGDAGGFGVAPISIGFVVFISLIEILVVAIQAYIFTFLSALYIGMATQEHEHH